MLSDTLQQQLGDALNYLVQLCEEGSRPEEARALLHLLCQRYPDTTMELLWEEEKYDQSVHYDVLLRSSKRPGTIMLSFCPDRALPWPLRNLHRWDEADLVRVNTTVLRMDQAIACLDFIWDDARATDRLINACLIQEELDREQVQISEEDLQEAMDGFRRAHRLYKAEDTFRWMKQHGMTLEQFERHVTDEAMVVKLRDRVVTAEQVEAYFAEHHADFDLAYVACLDNRMKSEIKKLLFDKWLAERRQAANIEWYWGNAGRTSPAS